MLEPNPIVGATGLPDDNNLFSKLLPAFIEADLSLLANAFTEPMPTVTVPWFLSREPMTTATASCAQFIVSRILITPVLGASRLICLDSRGRDSVLGCDN